MDFLPVMEKNLQNLISCIEVKSVTGNADRSSNSKLVASAGIKELKRFRSPRNVPDGDVPDVIGLGAREAISRLEAAGLKVKLHGYGYVARQSVRAGTKAEKGAIVELTLRE